MADHQQNVSLEPIATPLIEKRIYVIRGRQVMLDEDLADLYGVETKRLVEQVKRNLERFPGDFMFQLRKDEAAALRSQIATSNTGRGGRRYAPYVFTEQGVAMLSSVLRSKTAVAVNIEIMRTFVELRRAANSYAAIEKRLEQLERGMGEHGEQLEQIFGALRHGTYRTCPGGARRSAAAGVAAARFRRPDRATRKAPPPAPRRCCDQPPTSCLTRFKYRPVEPIAAPPPHGLARPRGAVFSWVARSHAGRSVTTATSF